MFNTIGFIGFGLIGGSLARSIKKHHPLTQITAYDIDVNSLKAAKNEALIQHIADDLTKDFSECDLVFLCCPVQVNVHYFKEITPYLKESCIVTDVGSTKLDIFQGIGPYLGNTKFIGGHPMTGSEKSGFGVSSHQLFENVYYILTPSKNVQIRDIDAMTRLIESIDSIPIVMDPVIHDQTTAAISHVPHILASQIVNMVKDLDSKEGYMHTLAAGGFKDITRIASASPVMWQQICLTNKEPILHALGHFQKLIMATMENISSDNSEALYGLFNEAKEFRDSFNDSHKGLIPKQFSFSVDVDDEPGIIARIATLLYEQQINIKNIGIVNNRETDQGVLRIVFDDEAHMAQSQILLKKIGFTIYTN